MSSEDERLRHAFRRRRNFIAKSLYDRDKNFKPKVVLRRDEPKKITLSDIRKSLDDED